MATTPKTAAKAAPKTDLSPAVFGVEVANHQLLKLAYEAYLANGRVATATTKTRGEVSGGGKKPWRQKGTGRARFGSTRNPIWRKGGIVFGPSGEENYTIKISKQSKLVALRQALSLANEAGKISVIEPITTTGKTKELVGVLADNNLTARRILLVVDEKTPELVRASRNLENVELVRSTYLTVYHILNADKIAMTRPAVAAVEAWLGGEK
ncbi:50S ribosomal protein L4 [Candidatus Saccharibacteria bacterium]|nr:MAG: 50S ribosomal protein L4 [Candidatus Saccharibacteria bacterium]